MIDVLPAHHRIVCDILNRHLPAGTRVWVFGSRANRTTTRASDLDLALDGESKIDYKITGAMEDAFEDSDLPYTVDVVDLKYLSPKFKQIVDKSKVQLRFTAKAVQNPKK